MKDMSKKLIGKRIESLLLKKNGGNQSELARHVGVTPQAVQQWISGETTPRGGRMIKAADFLNSSPSYIQFGEGNIEEYDPKGRLPLISWVQAGKWTEAIDNFQPGDAEDWLLCPFKHSPNAFILKVSGDSMFNPLGSHSYSDGEFIAVDPAREAVHGCRVVARLDDQNMATFKQLIVEADGTMMLKALNPAWPDPIIKINGNATICGVVIGKWTPE